MPETALLTADDEPSASAYELTPASECPALNEADNSIMVSINEKGLIQDAVNVDPDAHDSVPERIYDCAFQPYLVNGVPSPVTTALVPQSELKMVARYIRKTFGVSPD